MLIVLDNPPSVCQPDRASLPYSSGTSFLSYFADCGLPSEFCGFAPEYETLCKPHLAETNPELLAEIEDERAKGFKLVSKKAPKVAAAPAEAADPAAGAESATAPASGAGAGGDEAAPGASAEGGDPSAPPLSPEERAKREAEVKARAARAAKFVMCVLRETRAKKNKKNKKDKKRNKVSTGIVGIDAAGLDPKEACKTLGKRMGTASVLTKSDSGRPEIQLQGDHMRIIPRILVEELGVDSGIIRIVEEIDGKLRARKAFA